MTGKMKNIPINKLIKQLEANGSEFTIQWYATELNMPVESAAQTVASRIFNANDNGELLDDSIIDKVLSRALWRKYITDKVVSEIIEKAMTVDKFNRKEVIDDCLDRLNISYPTSAFIINAMYNVFPELRNGDTIKVLHNKTNYQPSTYAKANSDYQYSDGEIENEENYNDFWMRENS